MYLETLGIGQSKTLSAISKKHKAGAGVVILTRAVVSLSEQEAFTGQVGRFWVYAEGSESQG